MSQLAAHVRSVDPNQIREITQAAWAVPNAIVLSIGEPGFPTPVHVLQAAQETLARDETGYTPNAGICPLRAAFAERVSEQTGRKPTRAGSSSPPAPSRDCTWP